ncbi:hypothetical protein GCM10010470_37580 [Saccharopolyspora taberi]|uniref:Uncharacterized protein n=1 Tax=Saccharopolyspora taberi TaxID=60895 RepID=A0ABN3VF57_9PSEU
MPRPRFRIACCLCGKPIPQASDVYALDEEWKRRFPEMTGVLACDKCAVSGNQWRCRTADGSFVAGHRRAAGRPETRDHDSWDHIEAIGTQIAMVCTYPWSGLRQGAEEYLRYTARRPGLDQEVAQRIEDALHRWDGQPSDAGPPGG